MNREIKENQPKNRRQLAVDKFKESGLPDTAWNWHIWKRAFDAGWISHDIFESPELIEK